VPRRSAQREGRQTANRAADSSNPLTYQKWAWIMSTMAAVVPMTWTDEELVARSKTGDTESFNQLVKRWERPIFALAYRTLGREEDARDVTQETFLRAFRALSGFKGDAKFSSWLYRIALNLCRDWMRKDRRAPLVAVPDGVDVEDLAAERGPTETVEDLAARAELSREVAKAMTHLPAEQRQAIILKEYHGLTFQEIADLMQCPLSTVKTRVYQGLSTLRKQLGERLTPRRES
jgi:RNA polymerase sigma-70 factor (ECF subfamily)